MYYVTLSDYVCLYHYDLLQREKNLIIIQYKRRTSGRGSAGKVPVGRSVRKRLEREGPVEKSPTSGAQGDHCIWIAQSLSKADALSKWSSNSFEGH